MNQEERLQALRLIEEAQRGSDAALSGTSSAVVRIGGTTEEGQVEHTSLYIEEAPHRIIEELHDAGFTTSLDADDGMEVKADGLDGDQA